MHAHCLGYLFLTSCSVAAVKHNPSCTGCNLGPSERIHRNLLALRSSLANTQVKVNLTILNYSIVLLLQDLNLLIKLVEFNLTCSKMDPSKGRGRGESPQPVEGAPRGSRQQSGVQVLQIAERRSSSESGGETEPAIRGRGGFRSNGGDLRTIPDNIVQVHADSSAKGQSCDLLANFVKIQPMKEREVFQYRVDFSPNVESVRFRRKLLLLAVTGHIQKEDITYDSASDARSSRALPSNPFEKSLDHPLEEGVKVKVIIKKVGKIDWSSHEMIRLYNMNMKKFLRDLKFFQVSATGAFVHASFKEMISQNSIAMVRGFKTACALHESSQILINLESVHKLIQIKNVLQEIGVIVQNAQRVRQDANSAVKNKLIGKLVVPSYNHRTYRIEDVNFDLNPQSTFPDRATNRDLRYVDYFANRYNQRIHDLRQPLLLVSDNSRRREAQNEGGDIYLVPELCNLAGLTDEQRVDNRLKMELIKSSQVAPQKRVEQAREFLSMLHNNATVKASLESWGYSIDRNILQIRGRILPTEQVGAGATATANYNTWPKVDLAASFDRLVCNDKLAVVPSFPILAIVITKVDANNEQQIMSRLRPGITRVGLAPGDVKIIRIREGDSAHHYCSYLRQIPDSCTAAIVILNRQNKERYDAVKKVASVEKGLITQVVTARLMLDERKAASAAVKIGIQIAAKIGGEPWHVFMPLAAVMVCGYDTYHDTANRGRSFGAFVASTNRKLSRWFSKADTHDKIDELSVNLAANMEKALQNYKSINGSFPERVILYRDGVSDGQLEHVFKVELDKLRKVVEGIKGENIKLTVVIVNKRIGARFYRKSGDGFINPPPGTVIDDVVTRQNRYDFYLVSQSTRNGTINPTYYNIIYDRSGISPDKHQTLAFKLCFLYYNWTGTVRVPAPCQYAHKLAYLCGEHLHSLPNANLDDRLHFL